MLSGATTLKNVLIILSLISNWVNKKVQMKQKVLLSTFSIVVSVAVFHFSFANGQNHHTKENCFSLLQATSQRFSAGMRGGMSGIEYSFLLRINTKERLLFDSVWIGKYPYKVVVAKQRNFISNEPISYTKGDTITLKITTYNNSGNYKNIALNQIIYEGDGLIRYTIKTNSQHFIVKKIQKLELQKRA